MEEKPIPSSKEDVRPDIKESDVVSYNQQVQEGGKDGKALLESHSISTGPPSLDYDFYKRRWSLLANLVSENWRKYNSPSQFSNLEMSQKSDESSRDRLFDSFDFATPDMDHWNELLCLDSCVLWSEIWQTCEYARVIESWDLRLISRPFSTLHSPAECYSRNIIRSCNCCSRNSRGSLLPLEVVSID